MDLKVQDVQINVAVLDTANLKSDENQVLEQLLERARQSASKAYAPYSNFRVGAALMLDNGHVYSGSNQENAAYPSGLCAERTTLFYANAQEPDAVVKHILIYAETDNGPVSTPISPCGACRQVLIEKENTQKQPMQVWLAGKDVVYRLPSAESLLPFSFVPKSLEG